MNFTFTDKLPVDFKGIPVIISGADSLQYNGKDFLVSGKENVFEIRYKYHCSPFNEVIVSGDIMAVGHEEHFYIYDLSTHKNLLSLKMSGYFGSLYLHHELLYVADSGGVYCIDKQGNILWHNNSLAVDGITINDFTASAILGSGECDPPGGWHEFALDIHSGMVL